MITFNSPYRNEKECHYANLNIWLSAFNEMVQLDKESHFQIQSLLNIQNILNYNFKDITLLITALTHKSFFYENKSLVKSDNERLEFLGDSVVNFIVTKYLNRIYTELNEGELSKLRGSLVNEESFSALARSLDLSMNILIGKGELKNLGFNKNSILADAFEALLGAVLIDSNFEETEKVFWKIINHYEMQTSLKFVNLDAIDNYDSKSKLQELIMEKLSTTPTYKSLEIENGFQVELWISGKLLHSMQGVSKKKLEKELAKYVLEKNLIF